MASQEIIVTYKAEVDQLTQELKKIVVAQDQITKEQKEGQAQVNKNLTNQEQAAKKRLELLKLEEKELAKLKQLRGLAFDPKVIRDYDAQINKSLANIKTLGGKTEDALGGIGGKIKSIGAGIAAGFAAAFTVDAVINFSKASVNAFLEAEDTANRLKFAITTIGKESESAFDKLIKQSAELQEITIFSDDSVQQAQAALAAFGLTSDQIEDLIPKLADFATITSQDIPSAAQQIGAALEGNGREFRKYGIEVSATASRAENLGAIISGLAQFQGAAENATKSLTGSLKQQENQLDELQETIGEKLAPSFVNLKRVFLEFIDVVITSGDDIRAKSQLDTLADAATKTNTILEERAKNIERITGVTPNEAFIKALEKEIALATEAQEIASKGTLAKNVEEYKEASQRLEVLNKRLEEFNENLKATDQAAKAQQERLLTIEEARLLTTENLIKLSEKEAEIGDEVSKKNIKNIELVLKARQDYEAELKKNLERLENLEIASIEDVKAKRIALFEKEIKDLTAQGKLRADIINLLEIQLKKDLEKLDKQLGNTKIEPIELKVKLNVEEVEEVEVDQSKLEGRDIVLKPVDSTKFDNSIDKVEAKTLEGWIENNEAILNSSQELISGIADLYNQFTDDQIEQINKRTDAQLNALDTQSQSNNEALENRRVSERQAVANEKALEAQRVKIKEDSERKINSIKRKQFNIDKAAAITEITIDIVKAVAEIIGQTGVVGIGISAAVAALLGAQLAMVAAKPNPYAKGTKSSKAGLANVDEEGPEAIYSPKSGRLTVLDKGSKVLPAKQTKTYGEVLDAMYDKRFDKYIMQNYVTPALNKQKASFEKGKQQRFSDNIRESITLNQPGLTGYDLELNRRKGFNINNADQIAKAIAEQLQRDIYR